MLSKQEIKRHSLLRNLSPSDPREAFALATPVALVKDPRPSGIRYFVTFVADIRALRILALIEQIILSQIPAFLQFQILQQRRFNIQLNVITLTKSERNYVRT